MAKAPGGINPEIENTSSQTMDQTRLVIAVEYTADAIIITDIEGNIQYVNPAFEKITYQTNVGLPQTRRGLAGAIHQQEKR
jgi:nitrogen-specific signal transduction histidine kinase